MSLTTGARIVKKMVLMCAMVGIVSIVTLFGRAPRQDILKTGLLMEASGIVRSSINKGILWAHNDSGGMPEVYAIDVNGNFRATLVLDGVKNRDWEDIASWKDSKTGKSYLYIGEIGDNGARYPSVFVYKVEEPRLYPGDSLYVATSIEKYEITYEDGARDAEGLFIEPKSNDIYIISKREEQVGLYRVSKPSSTEKNVAKRVFTFPFGWVTAADISPNGKKLLVKTYTGIWQYKLGRTKSGELVPGNKPKGLPYMMEPQGEAVCFDARGRAYYTLSEAGTERLQILYYYK